LESKGISTSQRLIINVMSEKKYCNPSQTSQNSHHKKKEFTTKSNINKNSKEFAKASPGRPSVKLEVLKRHGFEKFAKGAPSWWFRDLEKLEKALIDKDWFEGTPDLFAYNKESRTMYVVDYKTGFHYVSAQNNAQLLSYANLIMLNHKEWKIENFVLSILNTQKDLCSHWYPEMETVLRHLARMKQDFDF